MNMSPGLFPLHIYSKVICKYRENPNLEDIFRSRHDNCLYDDLNSIFYLMAFHKQNRNILEFSIHFHSHIGDDSESYSFQYQNNILIELSYIIILCIN